MHGFEVASWANKNYDIQPQIIILTSLIDQAEGSYDVKAVDYVVKQIDNFDRLQEKALKIIKNVARFDGVTTDIIGSEQMFFRYAEIRYISKNANDTTIHLATGRKLETILTLEEWVAKLPHPQFIRTHKSNIVNADYFINISTNKNLIKLRGAKPEEEVKATKRNYKKILEQIFEYERQQARGVV